LIGVSWLVVECAEDTKPIAASTRPTNEPPKQLPHLSGIHLVGANTFCLGANDATLPN